MNYPKIHSAIAIDDHTLLIEFDNSIKKVYDITSLLDKEMFFPLKNLAFFRNVQVDKGGYAIIWNSEIDISEYEIWTHGTFPSRARRASTSRATVSGASVDGTVVSSLPSIDSDSGFPSRVAR